MATVLKDILHETGLMPDASLPLCVAISCGVLVFYCVTGGIIASVYTDLFQGLIMMVAAVLVFYSAVTAVPGGFHEMSQTIRDDNAAAIGPFGTLGILGCLSWYFLFGLGISGQPHVVSKLMMNKRVEDARHILPLSILGYGVSALLWISIGMVMRTLVLQGNHPPLEHEDLAAPQFLQHYAHPLLSGVVTAGLLAAIMSTADSFLNIGSAAVIHDIPRSILGRPLRRELLGARVATVAIATVAALFALYTGDLVALLGAFGWGTFAAALVPAVAIGLNWKRATSLAVNSAIIAGLAINFGIKLFDIQMPYRLDGGAVALLVSLILFFGISLMSRPPKIAPDVAEVMDL